MGLKIHFHNKNANRKITFAGIKIQTQGLKISFNTSRNFILKVFLKFSQTEISCWAEVTGISDYLVLTSMASDRGCISNVS